MKCMEFRAHVSYVVTSLKIEQTLEYHSTGRLCEINWLTIIVNTMVNSVIVVNDAQYGTPAIIFKATLGVYMVMPNSKQFLTMNENDANRRTNLLLNLEKKQSRITIESFCTMHIPSKMINLNVTIRKGGESPLPEIQILIN